MSERPIVARLRDVWKTAASAGELMPSEDALAEELGTSRPTIREALVRLEGEGLLRRWPGSGTFPNIAALDMPTRLDQHTDFGTMLREAGYVATSETLDARWTEVPDRVAALLGVKPKSPAFETQKRWSADGTPVMVAQDIIPLRLAARPEVDPSDSVLQLALALGNDSVDWICTWPGARNLDDEDAILLDSKPGTAVLALEHVGVRRRGSMCFYANEIHIPGYLRYGLILSVGE